MAQTGTQPAVVAHLSHVALGATDVRALARFYEDVLGVSPHEELPDGRVRLGWTSGHHALELVPAQPGLDHFGFEVPHERHLEQMLAALERDGVEATQVTPEGSHPTSRLVRDPDGNRLELHGRIDRSGERPGRSARRPVRIHHVTLSTPSIEPLLDFYAGTLGFRISDRMGEVFVWLRSSREHHTLAIVKGERPGIDHYAFELHGWEDFKTWCDELAARDVSVSWGPGRHGPGNNLFVMFDDPEGHHVELSSELERFWDDRAEYTPRQWAVEPRTVNLWGAAPDWRGSAAWEQ